MNEQQTEVRTRTRPSGEVDITVRVPLKLKESLEGLAVAERRSLSKQARVALEDYLARLDPNAPPPPAQDAA